MHLFMHRRRRRGMLRRLLAGEPPAGPETFLPLTGRSYGRLEWVQQAIGAFQLECERGPLAWLTWSRSGHALRAADDVWTFALLGWSLIATDSAGARSRIHHRPFRRSRLELADGTEYVWHSGWRGTVDFRTDDGRTILEFAPKTSLTRMTAAVEASESARARSDLALLAAWPIAAMLESPPNAKV